MKFTYHYLENLCLHRCKLFDILFSSSNLFDFIFHFTASEPALRIDEHKDSVICAQFNAKGHLLATGDMTGLIVISSTPVIKKCCMVSDSY